MTRRIFCRVLFVVIAILGLLVFSRVLLAQGRSHDAFEQVKEVQERHTHRLMAIDGVEGTAVGLDDSDRPAVKVFLEKPGVRGIPRELDGVPVHAVVTGKIYAFSKPSVSPGQTRRPPKDTMPPAAPTGLTATAVSSSQIDLNWADNTESDLSYYNVYRSTSGGSYSRIASNVRLSAYSNTGLTAETTYYYAVTAVDKSGNESSKSEQASATTQVAPIPPLWCERPVPIGVSTGHPNITAGTISCRVKDASGNVYALSNNHVYADENRAKIGDNVLQPGPYDGGQNPRDAIGTLADFESIVFSRRANNTIDAAIALSSTSLLGNATPSNGYGTPKTTTAAAYVGQAVQKYGRTTGLTTGKVYAINATVNVGYDSGVARFINQIIITPGTFSSGGDSGSLIVTETGKNPVGLLFAGSSTVTVANPIDLVLDRFGVTIDGVK